MKASTQQWLDELPKQSYNDLRTAGLNFIQERPDKALRLYIRIEGLDPEEFRELGWETTPYVNAMLNKEITNG